MIKLIAFFSTGVPALFALIFSHLSRKFATATAGVLAIAAMLVLFIACINEILQAVLNVLQVPPWLLVGLGMFIPVNFSIVLSSIVSAKICRAAFDYAYKKADVIVKAN